LASASAQIASSTLLAVRGRRQPAGRYLQPFRLDSIRDEPGDLGRLAFGKNLGGNVDVYSALPTDTRRSRSGRRTGSARTSNR